MHQPNLYDLPSAIGQFELSRAGGFLLDNGRTLACTLADLNVFNSQANQVAGSELAVDRKVEQCQIPLTALDFEPRAYGPNIPRLQWSLLTDQLTLVPRDLLIFGGA
jgi:hypothetical protein